jgi:hypothetical protein
MSSNSKQTAKIRKRKASRQGKQRKKQMRIHGSTPSLDEILRVEEPGKEP